MKYRFKYQLAPGIGGGVIHDWSAIGSLVGINVHFSDYRNDAAMRKVMEGNLLTGGIEFHHRSPPDYMKDEAPSHDHCWLLQCPCWHDGSSMSATDFWIPFWLENEHDHQRMFDEIAERLNRSHEEIRSTAGELWKSKDEADIDNQ